MNLRLSTIINEQHKQLQKQAEALFERGMKRKNIFVYWDPDVDGCIAGYLVSEYLARVYPEVSSEIIMNEHRAHGCFYKENMRDGFIINVDSGMTEVELKLFTDNNCIVLSLDHHKLPEYEGSILHTVNTAGEVMGLIYNSDYPYLEDRYGYLSGAGVVDLFFSLYDTRFKTPLTDAYVGITLLSDARPIENVYARKTLEATYELNILDIPFIKTNIRRLINASYDSPISKLDRNFIDFKLSPFINAVLRCNANQHLIESFLYDEECLNYKGLQSEVIKELKDALHTVEFDTYILCVADRNTKEHETYAEPNMIGLIANRVLNETGKTVVILYKEDGVLKRGSVRGKYHTVDYLTIFQAHGFSAAGHPGAFGVLGIEKRVDMYLLNQALLHAEAQHEETNEIIEIYNLRTYADYIRRVAYENQFVRPLYKKYIRYTGTGATCINKKTNYIVYAVDGIQVKGFDPELDIRDALILPVYNNHLVDYVLERRK